MAKKEQEVQEVKAPTLILGVEQTSGLENAIVKNAAPQLKAHIVVKNEVTHIIHPKGSIIKAEVSYAKDESKLNPNAKTKNPYVGLKMARMTIVIQGIAGTDGAEAPQHIISESSAFDSLIKAKWSFEENFDSLIKTILTTCYNQNNNDFAKQTKDRSDAYSKELMDNHKDWLLLDEATKAYSLNPEYKAETTNLFQYHKFLSIANNINEQIEIVKKSGEKPELFAWHIHFDTYKKGSFKLLNVAKATKGVKFPGEKGKEYDVVKASGAVSSKAIAEIDLGDEDIDMDLIM